MTAAPTLFDWQEDALPARATDPVTSRAAAKSVNEAARKAEVLAAMATWPGGRCTASQIHSAIRSGMDIGSVRSRLSQLRKEDPPRARKTGGIRQVPKPIGSGRPEQVWEIAPAGRAWLDARGER